MNAAAYKYAVKINNLEAFGPGYFPLSDYSNDAAGLLYDGNAATGYSGTSSTGDVSAGALIDLGSVPSLSAFLFRFVGTIGDDGIYVSSDGISWTGRSFSAAGPPNKYNLQAGTSGRYIQFTAGISINPPATLGITEFYVYDSTGTVVGPPAAPSPPTASLSASPPTIYPGDSTALTWTTGNATSQSINNGVGSVAASGSVSVSPTVTTTYTLTATGAGGTTTTSATVTVLPPRREVHIFSTGTLYATVAGNQIEFALLQNVMLMFQGTQKRLYDCPIRSMFPIDVAYTDGNALMQAETASISPDAVVTMLGGSLSGSSALKLLTLSKTLSKTPFSLALTLQDTTGKQHVWTFNNVYCPDLRLPVKATDFLMPAFNLFGLPDAGGVVATVAMAQ